MTGSGQLESLASDLSRIQMLIDEAPRLKRTESARGFLQESIDEVSTKDVVRLGVFRGSCCFADITTS